MQRERRNVAFFAAFTAALCTLAVFIVEIENDVERIYENSNDGALESDGISSRASEYAVKVPCKMALLNAGAKCNTIIQGALQSSANDFRHSKKDGKSAKAMSEKLLSVAYQQCIKVVTETSVSKACNLSKKAMQAKLEKLKAKQAAKMAKIGAKLHRKISKDKAKRSASKLKGNTAQANTMGASDQAARYARLKVIQNKIKAAKQAKKQRKNQKVAAATLSKTKAFAKAQMKTRILQENEAEKKAAAAAKAAAKKHLNAIKTATKLTVQKAKASKQKAKAQQKAIKVQQKAAKQQLKKQNAAAKQKAKDVKAAAKKAKKEAAAKLSAKKHAAKIQVKQQAVKKSQARAAKLANAAKIADASTNAAKAALKVAANNPQQAAQYLRESALKASQAQQKIIEAKSPKVQ